MTASFSVFFTHVCFGSQIVAQVTPACKSKSEQDILHSLEEKGMADIFEHVTLQGNFDISPFRYDEKLGFYYSQDRMLGFVAGWPPTRPPRDWEDLEEEDRLFMHYPKGIGTRIATSARAQIEPSRHKQQKDIYLVAVGGVTTAKHNIGVHDARNQGFVKGIARHAGLLAASWLYGDRYALEKVAQPYGDAGMVRLDLPPSWQAEHKMRNIEHPVPPEMRLLRNPEFTTQVVGEVSLAGLTSKG